MKTLNQCHVALYEPIYPVTRLLLRTSDKDAAASASDALPKDVRLCVIRVLMALHMDQCIDQACGTRWRVRPFDSTHYMILRDDADRTYNTMEFPWDEWHEYITVQYRGRDLHINNLYYAPYRYPIALVRSRAWLARSDWETLTHTEQAIYVFLVLFVFVLWWCITGPLIARCDVLLLQA